MKVKLVFKEEDFGRLRHHLLQPDGLERAAFVFLGSRRSPKGPLELYAQRLLIPADEAYEKQGPAEVEMHPEFVLEAFNHFLQTRPAGLLHAHSHPFSTQATFSAVDDHFLPKLSLSLSRYLELRKEPRPFVLVRLVLGQNEEGFSGDSFDEKGRFLGRIAEIRVVGPRGIRILGEAPKPLSSWENAVFDRNIKAFGKESQAWLRSLHLGICGLGGVGSLFAAYARGLGFRRFTLVDPDRVEASNLNRLLGATPKDVGKPKVAVVARELRRSDPRIEVNPVFGRVQEAKAQKALVEADVLVGCVDNDAARMELQILAARFLKPLLDLGAGIILREGKVREMAGQAAFYFPGGPCLLCQGLDPANLASEEVLALREAFGYVQGGPVEETPTAVVTINAGLAALAADLLVRYLTGFSSVPTFLRFDLLNHKFVSLRFQKREDCPICGKEGVEGMGEELPRRKPRTRKAWEKWLGRWRRPASYAPRAG
jgi:molybdopterin/thiamine biosynthesis adenylyltransferase